MVQTSLIPDNTVVKLTIPKNYVGKKMYALFYIDEEIVPSNNTAKVKTNPIMQINNAKEISPLVQSLTGIIPNINNDKDEYYDYLTQKYS